MSCIAELETFSNWEGFCLEPAKINGLTNIFGIAEFVPTLALLVVVVTISDFRYRYRFAVQRFSVRTQGIWIAAAIGLLLVLTEIWFQNSLPIPHFANSYGNLKILLGAAFLLLVFYVVAACFLRPPKFRRSNAEQFFQATVHFIHEGNADRMQVVAEELSGSIAHIFEYASRIPSDAGTAQRKLTPEQESAHHLLLLIADRRFCHVIVERVPRFALACFELAANFVGPHSTGRHGLANRPAGGILVGDRRGCNRAPARLGAALIGKCLEPD